MKLEDVKIGSEFRLVDDRDSKGIIIGLPDRKEFVKIAWSDSYSPTEDIHMDELKLSDPEADKILAGKMQVKIDAATTAFEQAFLALQELHAIEQDVMLDAMSLQGDGFLSMEKLEEAVETFGWSTSSLYC
jgi:hypothetical protein